jgi:hypothetical protein
VPWVNSSHFDPARRPNALHSVALPLGGAGGFRIEQVIGTLGILNSFGIRRLAAARFRFQLEYFENAPEGFHASATSCR